MRTLQAILGFLTWRPMSGYEIRRTIGESVANFWSESFGQIYPALRRLAARGYVEVDEIGAEGGGRERICYRLTEAGQAALARWLAEPVQPPRPRNELLLKLFFGRHAGAGVIEEHLLAFRRRIEADRARYAAVRTRIERDSRRNPEADYWLLTLRYGELERDALLRWSDEAIARIGELDAERSASQTLDARQTENET